LKRLQLADDLKLPADEAVTQKYGFIGRSGSGKSYAAMKLAELFLGAGAQIIALDWVGIWWSLRLAKNGKAPGFEHVYIFGGEHADVDLKPESGALMADLIVDKHISVVLDVMHFRKAERTRFATAFAEQFFHRKKTARTACHLFIEEAQAYLPQMVRGEEARMVGVFEDIGKVGRNYGIGNSLISQRPQAINKDVLNQVEVLLAFQTNGPQERKAIAGWTAENTTAGAAMIQQLPTLKVGHALVWSPQWLRIAHEVHIAERETYNSSSTPTQDVKTIAPKRLSPAELEDLGEAVKLTIEKAKADDPRELKRQIADKETRIKELERTGPGTPNVVLKPEKVPALTDADRALIEKLAGQIDGWQVEAQRQIAAGHERLRESIQEAVKQANLSTHVSLVGITETIIDLLEKASVKKLLEKLNGLSVQVPGSQFPVPRRPISQKSDNQPTRQLSPSSSATPASIGDLKLSSSQQVLLNALAWLESVSIPQPRRGQLALVAKVSSVSSGFEKNLSTLKTAGAIVYPGDGLVALTDVGRAIAVKPDAPPSSQELHDSLIARVSGPQGILLRELIAIYPGAINREDLAARAQVSAVSSGFEKNLSTLKSLGLAEYPRQGFVRATDVLFLEAR
jgi:uncharacterized protein